MAQTVTLDALIKREDFASTSSNSHSSDSVNSLSVESLSSAGMISNLLRKPDFQRETNQWKPNQLVSFLESFLDDELIPSVILWQGAAHVFVIDGGHRLSALKAWIENDYGDGPISLKYFENDISLEQQTIAERTRKLVEKKIGSYSRIRNALINPEAYEEVTVRRARKMATRQLTLQWVSGDADKAESSFFKINTQGTPLHDTEEALLRNRSRSIAIAARSIVRAATGHKYWSKFDPKIISEIESLSQKAHVILFNPEVRQPVKTLDLPLGGSKSPIVALGILMQLISVSTLGEKAVATPIKDFPEDAHGDETISLLKSFIRTVGWISGPEERSLGLHPAIYFYSEQGRHLPDLLIGMTHLFAQKQQSNQKTFFKEFTDVRVPLEALLIQHKFLITQALQSVRSTSRYVRVSEFFNEVTKSLKSGKTPDEGEIASIITRGESARVLALHRTKSGADFSDQTKSAAFIREALKQAIKCEICGGYLDPQKSMSYDHKKRKSEGGGGAVDNCDLTHHYCNTGYKG
ncbi:MAG: HNH endonuclease family protein [Hyphomonas sp.]